MTDAARALADEIETAIHITIRRRNEVGRVVYENLMPPHRNLLIAALRSPQPGMARELQRIVDIALGGHAPSPHHLKCACTVCEMRRVAENAILALAPSHEAGRQYDPAFVKSILDADGKPPEAAFSNAQDALAYLNDERAGTQDPVAWPPKHLGNCKPLIRATGGRCTYPDCDCAPLPAAPASHDATREALFEPETAHAGWNLEGALHDIRRLSEAGKPTDAVCIRTIERVCGQLFKAEAALASSPIRADREGGQ